MSGERPVALVTGAAGGIGQACCRALAAEGFRVGVHHRKSAEAARNFRDKSRMKDALRAADVPCARHALVGSGAAAREFARVTGLNRIVWDSPNARFGIMPAWLVDYRPGSGLTVDEINAVSLYVHQLGGGE